MTDRLEFLQHARRVHGVLRSGINNADGRQGDALEDWLANEQPLLAHAACGMYLASCLAYLEGTYGERCWDDPGASAADLDSFVSSHPSDGVRHSGVSADALAALVDIRNACTHNGGDLSLNRSSGSLARVQAAGLPGVSLNGSVVTLLSTPDTDFMQLVRLSLVVVAMYHGDG